MGRSWQEWANERGYRMACGDPTVIDEVQAEIEGRRAAGEFDEAFYRSRMESFHYFEGIDRAKARTVLMLAVPRPEHRVVFGLENGQLAAAVPPTFAWNAELDGEIRADITSSLLPPGSSLIPLPAPKKAVAARLGLVNYGLNNITYAPGLGSYHQLHGYLTDAELGPWSRLAVDTVTIPPECQRCLACQKACPTGAIGPDRFLLHAERCLTFFSENEDPWPDWLDPSIHHCLVGCMICQEVCPRNIGLLRIEPVPESFDPVETARILAGPPEEPDPLWAGIAAKLAAVGLRGYETILGRNLRALLGNGSHRKRMVAE